MPGPDPAHWLHRLTAPEWLATAGTELAHAEAAAARRATRAAVTHARRAAGMAWNAVLVDRPDERAGRSYMEHVVALCEDVAAPESVRAAARLLRESPAAQPALIKLAAPGAPPDTQFLRAAREIVDHAARVVTPS
jgi:HEPN domain-containing protein